MHRTLLDLLERNADHARAFETRFGEVQGGQTPEAVTVCCSDSRVLQDHIWSNDTPGRLFTCANIGNRVVQRAEEGTTVSGDVLYPIEHAETDLAVVVGHTGCGAVTAAYEGLAEGGTEPPGIEHCLDLLAPHLQPGIEALPDGLDHATAVNHLVEYNVDRQVEYLLDSDDVSADVDIIGVVYDFQDVYEGGRRGEVHVVNVDGTRDVAALRDEHSAAARRVQRLWEY